MLTIDKSGHVVVDHTADEIKEEDVANDAPEKHCVTTDVPLVPMGQRYGEGANVHIPKFDIFPGTPVSVQIDITRGYVIDTFDVVYNNSQYAVRDMESLKEYTLRDGTIPNSHILEFIMPNSDVHIVLSVKK